MLTLDQSHYSLAQVDDEANEMRRVYLPDQSLYLMDTLAVAPTQAQPPQKKQLNSHPAKALSPIHTTPTMAKAVDQSHCLLVQVGYKEGKMRDRRNWVGECPYRYPYLMHTLTVTPTNPQAPHKEHLNSHPARALLPIHATPTMAQTVN